MHVAYDEPMTTGHSTRRRALAVGLGTALALPLVLTGSSPDPESVPGRDPGPGERERRRRARHPDQYADLRPSRRVDPRDGDDHEPPRYPQPGERI